MKNLKQPEEVQHQPIPNSSSVKTIGYDEATQELHVAFHNTGSYVYQNVPKHLYDGLMMSGSKGKYLHNQIKPHFGFSKNGESDG